MRTLLADDNSEIRAALRLLLAELGESDLVEAADLGEARAAMSAASFDVVLLDWELTGSGDEDTGGERQDEAGAGTDEAVCQSARFVREAKANAPCCRIVALSGRPESRAECLKSGCDAFVSRTDPPDGLVALLADMRPGPAR